VITIRSAAVAALLLLGATAVPADEGMWMPQQIPGLAGELRAAGMTLDPERLADLTGDPMGAVVSLGGCTASFVSPEGLIVTNHHCVYGTVQYNSTPERNLIHDGFLARTRGEELPAAPGSYVYVTTAIRDVTAQVLAGLDAKTPDLERQQAIERRQRELVDACEKPGAVRCRVASFYEGSLFLETTQAEIRDVRLVYAPGEGIGNFGGETDNWMWPRHTGDFGFLRAYVGPDGKPADPSPANAPYRPEHWLKVAEKGVAEGDLVWIPGYPGRTYRYKTAAEVESARAFAMPEFVRFAKETIAILERENERGKEVELANYARIRGAANTMKKYEGILAALERGEVARQREERERRVGELLARDPALRARLGDPLAELGRIEERRRATERRDWALDQLARSSPMLAQAMTLRRMAEERPKPDLEREDGYRERDLSRFRQGVVRAQRSIEPGSDRATLRWAIARALELPAGQRIEPLDRALAATGAAADAARVEALLDRLYAGTKMADLETRKAMAEEELAALDARGDAMLAFVAELSPLLEAKRQASRELEGAMLRVRPSYLAALEALDPGKVYPDANSTLRFTYGKVTGYAPRDGVAFAPRTTLDGVVEKATGERPFDAPPALLAEAADEPPAAYRDARLGTVPVDFLSTCDITGGNSGSPTLNAKGELVGLAFDGNLEGVVSDFLFDDEIVRTIHVDAVYVRWVMDEVDRAHHLLAEMGLPVVTSDEHHAARESARAERSERAGKR
jgi:hypothetical protein